MCTDHLSYIDVSIIATDNERFSESEHYFLSQSRITTSF